MLRDLLGQPDDDAPAAPRKAGLSVLAARSHFEGNLRTEGNVQLEDRFTGDIVAHGQVWIGKQAALDGNLTCQQARVDGLVRGDVQARVVQITQTGRVLGALRMEQLLTEEGAQFEGLVTLEESFDPLERQPDPDAAPDEAD